MGYRAQYAWSPKVALALALENSQYQFSATNAASNFFFGGSGAGPGLNNPTFPYTNQIAPDVIAKAVFEPGYGHYEVGGVLRLFRDRVYPNAPSSTGAYNDTKAGGGLILNARFPVGTKLDAGLHFVGGTGMGRYGTAILPDITVRPNGELATLLGAQALLSLEYHPTKQWDVFGYAGTEYVGRSFAASSTGTLVGYGVPTVDDSGCSAEAAASGSSGTSPGAGTCNGATRDLAEGSFGFAYRPYAGPVGRLQLGFAYSYLSRSGWYAVGGAPSTNNNMVFTSVRWYLP